MSTDPVIESHAPAKPADSQTRNAKKAGKPKKVPKTAAGRLCAFLRESLAHVPRTADPAQLEKDGVVFIQRVVAKSLKTTKWDEIMPSVRSGLTTYVVEALIEAKAKKRPVLPWDGKLKLTDDEIKKLIANPISVPAAKGASGKKWNRGRRLSDRQWGRPLALRAKG